MGFKDSWNSLTNWWMENITTNQRKLSKGLSWLLVVVISNLITPITAWLSGGSADWRSYAIICTVAGIGYSIMFIESIFGAAEKPIDLSTPIVSVMTPVAPTPVVCVAPEPVAPVIPEEVIPEPV
jgi:hypothetical protein